jgi:hypothetical protein
MPDARKYALKDLMPLQNNCLRAISGAYRATPIRNLEVEVGVPPLGVHLDSLQARFRATLEESEVAGVNKEAVGKVERCLAMEQEGNVRRRRRRRQGAQGVNLGDTRGRMAGSSNGDEGERGGTAVEDGRGVVDDGVEMASRGLPQGAATTPSHSRLSWALQWLPEDDPRRSLSLQTRAKQKAQQAWHSMWQASAPSPALSTSIDAPPGTDVLALPQPLQMPESALAVQLPTGKNDLNAFLYQAHVPSVLCPLCSCGFGHQTAKHNIIHCRNFSAARHALRDDYGHLPDFKQPLTIPTGLQKVTKWVIERGILGQYHRAGGFLYPVGPLSLAND